MEHIQAIQELIDQNKESIPTGVATDVMKECQAAYRTLPKLYKLTWTTVDSHAHVEHCHNGEDITCVKLDANTQTLIVEAVDHPPDHISEGAMPYHGMVLASWLKLPMPCTMMQGINNRVSSLRVVHSIVPYEPRKRTRE